MSSWNGLRQKMPDVFDFHLGLNRIGGSPHFEHKTSCITLCREGAPAAFDAERMLIGAYDALESYWIGEKRRRSPRILGSPENWRWELMTNLAARNLSPETLLERALAKLAATRSRTDWANQVPTASGMTTARNADRRTNIDLIRDRDNGVFDFIELKWAINTPLYAAIEIVC